MPLIDQQTIDSLKRPDGTYSHFSLYLLGAVGPVQKDDPAPLPDWQEHVLCTRISKVTLRCIRNEAKRLARMKPKPLSRTPRTDHPIASPATENSKSVRPSAVRSPRSLASEMRTLKRKLRTLNQRQLELIDQINETIHGKAA